MGTSKFLKTLNIRKFSGEIRDLVVKIKNNTRRLLALHHPDVHFNASEAEKEQHARLWHEITLASEFFLPETQKLESLNPDTPSIPSISVEAMESNFSSVRNQPGCYTIKCQINDAGIAALDKITPTLFKFKLPDFSFTDPTKTITLSDTCLLNSKNYTKTELAWLLCGINQDKISLKANLLEDQSSKDPEKKILVRLINFFASRKDTKINSRSKTILKICSVFIVVALLGALAFIPAIPLTVFIFGFTVSALIVAVSVLAISAFSAAMLFLFSGSRVYFDEPVVHAREATSLLKAHGSFDMNDYSPDFFYTKNIKVDSSDVSDPAEFSAKSLSFVGRLYGIKSGDTKFHQDETEQDNLCDDMSQYQTTQPRLLITNR